MSNGSNLVYHLPSVYFIFWCHLEHQKQKQKTCHNKEQKHKIKPSSCLSSCFVEIQSIIPKIWDSSLLSLESPFTTSKEHWYRDMLFNMARRITRWTRDRQSPKQDLNPHLGGNMYSNPLCLEPFKSPFTTSRKYWILYPNPYVQINKPNITKQGAEQQGISSIRLP